MTQKGPVLFDLDDDAPAPTPAEAPPVPDTQEPAPQGQAMTTVAALAARPTSRLARWFWTLLLALITTVASVAAWNFVTDLLTQNVYLGYAVAALFALFIAVVLMIVVKELSAFARLGRIDRIQHDAETALAAEDLKAARSVIKDLDHLYRNRDDTRWGRDRLKDRESDMFDASALLALADHELLGPLDQAAQREVEAAARQVATVTALVPLALADVVAALGANIRMIRRIAEIYGGRSGTLGSWRLTRAVLSHLVATGAVAVGDDMLEPILGGGILGKLSRRFGEGLVNGALTARVGVAAMEVCRPLPYVGKKRPSVRSIIKSALSGLITSTSQKGR
ncbi:YcjF family protein [Marivita hallyeonensis]|uniref:Putative membrane protein n=1 Tax=Marivita hallyeonensis TaxID=996342 RepID=A0A1M5MHN5_9RHOB|nr:TIGR01620 family protein [Marivita hallyeonensis]SHG76848.1 putative membrane protein [Marivita hallyeonensis]